MTNHTLSPSDLTLQCSFADGSLSPAEFSHRAHVSLAYTYLVQSGVDGAQANMRSGLIGYLRHHGIDSARFHETLTRAWLLAVWHFMQQTAAASSSEDLIAQNPMLLDSRIMLTHYSVEVLFSPDARTRFVEPDLDPIPLHHA